MIVLHKINGTELVINAELVESLESGHETVVALTTGNRYVVRESTKEVIAKIVDYKRQIHGSGLAVGAREEA